MERLTASFADDDLQYINSKKKQTIRRMVESANAVKQAYLSSLNASSLMKHLLVAANTSANCA